MNKPILLAVAAMLLTMAVPSAVAQWPPCTCDPNPVTDLVKCLKDDRYCEDHPEVRQVKQLLHDLDPRNWPCTCDPPPEPLDPAILLA